MKIFVDESEVRNPTDSVNLSEILKPLIGQCLSEKKVVVGITLDGQEIGGLESDQYDDLDISQAQELRLITGPRKEVAIEVLLECADTLPRLVEAFSSAVEHLHQGRTSEGMQLIEYCLGIWIELGGGIEASMTTLDIDLATIRIPVPRGEEAVPAGVVLERINQLLEETYTAFKNEDNLEIGDILEYDLPPLLRTFQEALYQVVEQVRASS